MTRPTADQQTLQTVKTRILEHLLERGCPSRAWYPLREEDLEGILANQREDGSWADIDYADTSQFGPEQWMPWKHLARLEAMALRIRRLEKEGREAGPLISRALAGLGYWFEAKPQCVDNYWHMAMGRNLSMKSLVLLLEPWLPAEYAAAALEELHYAVQDLDGDGVFEYHYPALGVHATGQNTLWLADIHLHAALLKENGSEVRAAAAALGGLMAITDGEGINEDFSFLQHGPQIYNGAYGAGFACDAARHAFLLRGTSLAYTPEQMGILRGYFLDGQQWMIRRSRWDPQVLGRSIGRKNNTRVSEALRQSLLDLAVADAEYSSRYLAMVAHLDGKNDAQLVGHKHFHRADYTVHRRKDYSFHIRTLSPRTLASETGNRENIQNYYLSQGSAFLMLDGEEYAETFPCWHWDRVPGVTAPQRRPAPSGTLWGHAGIWPFVGSAGNGVHGLTLHDLNWDGATGKKSWFCFEEDIVCLGTGLCFYPMNLPLHTTLNTARRRSGVTVAYDAGAGMPAPEGEACLLDRPTWVHHDGVGYFFAEPAEVELRNQVQTSGDWNAINPGLYNAGSTETCGLFSLAIRHGIGRDGGSYAYILLPGQTPAGVRAYAAQPRARIIANTPQVQAVRRDDLKASGIAFLRPGKIGLHPSLEISADKRCLLWVDESSTGEIKVSASRCEAGGALRVHLFQAGQALGILDFDLPGGPHTGQAITSSLRYGRFDRSHG